jgi:valyl-tRNA synthetase
MLDKTFQPAEVESRIGATWEQAQAFAAGAGSRGGKNAPYCIVIPPPNVTGSLHMGHALNNTVQDVLIRFERMRGRDVLWQPGTDHAGIATQMVVERQLAADKQPSRRDLGREEFLRRVWAWKEESGGTILNQLKRLGASCDWGRERFTMDPGLSKAVLKVFVELHKKGLIYKDKRLVNWDPKFQTAISDLEVVQKEVKGNLWRFRYPLKGQTFNPDDASTFITVATTRPETMLGDTAVAVHPEDARYSALIGKTCVLPLVGREIPIVADDYSDPEKGSGAVKITPAHDFNDFEVGRRHNLPNINIFDAFARLNDQVPDKYRGLDRFEARKRIVADMEAASFLAKIEPTKHTVPHGDRSDVPIEPWLTDQWYVNAAELARPALAAVRAGKTRFVPERFANDYYRWLENIQPWCISRQLWWGHQIPAWYGPDGKVFVAFDETEAHQLARAHYSSGGRSAEGGAADAIKLARDPDVLDTWFSSALWPFSTLGWPEKTAELKRYYPTATLVTGFDIIFFWVARMMMMGVEFMGEVPFDTVYIHGLVRDASGQKMSKSKGNVLDPLELIDEYGADALRFCLAAQASQGSDVKFSKQRVEGYRNFATKLWNAARFCEMNECVRQRDFDPAKAEHMLNRWVIGETERATKAVTAGLEAFKLNDAAAAAYEFVWGVFCDWYLELIKPILAGDDDRAKAETRAAAAWVLDQILKLLHPFMPFITEELWAHMVEYGLARRSLIAHAEWPAWDGLADEAADREIGWIVRLISEVRSVRSEMNVPAGAKIALTIAGGETGVRERIGRHEDTIKRLARAETIGFARSAPKGAALVVLGETTVAVPLDGVIDLDKERQRLTKEIKSAESDIAKMDAKLTNPAFMAKAKEEAIEEAKERKAELTVEIKRLKAALKRIED